MGKDKCETRVARVLSSRCPDTYKELFNELFFPQKKRETCVVSLLEGSEFSAEKDGKRMLPTPPPSNPKSVKAILG